VRRALALALPLCFSCRSPPPACTQQRFATCVTGWPGGASRPRSVSPPCLLLGYNWARRRMWQQRNAFQKSGMSQSKSGNPVGTRLQMEFIKLFGLNSIKPLLWGQIMEFILKHSSSSHSVEGEYFSSVPASSSLFSSFFSQLHHHMFWPSQLVYQTKNTS
jgi:hypothetical protein